MTRNLSASPPIITIVGRSRAGKTSLLEKLIPALKKRGFQVGTVKHHVHADFEIDKPGKDSWRHTRAGSDHVIISAPKKIASVRTLDRELSLDEIVTQFSGMDIILAEGFSRAGKARIEVVRGSQGDWPIRIDEQLLAIVADVPLDASAPLFSPENVEPLADLIQATFL